MSETLMTGRPHDGLALGPAPLRLSALMFSALAVLATGQTARAADVEAFETQGRSSDRPNVLFVIDSTVSMGSTVTIPPYDHSFTYSSSPAGCADTSVYFRPTAVGPFTDCSKSTGQNRLGEVPIANLKCDGLNTANVDGYVGPMKFVEEITVKQGNNITKSYQPLQTTVNSANKVFCENYSGTDKPPTGPNNTTVFDNVAPLTLYYGNYLNYFTVAPTLGPTAGAANRMDKVKDALYRVATKYSDKINLGLMRTSTTGALQTGGAGKGGMVLFPVKPMDDPAIYVARDIGGDQASLPNVAPDGKINTLDDFQWTLHERISCKGDQNCSDPFKWPTYPTPATCPVDPATGKPTNDCIPVMHPNGSAKALAELLYEASLYYSGSGVQYGTRSAVDPTIDFDSVAESLQNPAAAPGNWLYSSPVTACANNYVILLTDGLSEQDSSSNQAIADLLKTLPSTVLQQGGYDVRQPRCTTNNWSANAKAPSECIDDLAFYLKNADFDGLATNGRQGALTYTIGFDLTGSQDEVDATALLNDVAAAGGTGKMVNASAPDALTGILDSIVASILSANTSFSAPSVTINAFNRTQNLNDLYMAVFRPEFANKWEGNVKKFTIRPQDGKIIDKNGDVAVDDAKGFFKVTSQSLWSGLPDGKLAPEGGAASRLPDSTSRKIYVDSAGTTLAPLDTFAATEAVTSPGTFGAANSTEALGLVNWLYGVDTYDEYPVGIDPQGNPLDGNGVTAEESKLMGDPLHSRPAVVVYGQATVTKVVNGTNVQVPDPDDAVVYISTNQGLLHALDAKTGVELWSFAPKELLYRLKFLSDQANTTPLAQRTGPEFYGIDGTVRVLRIDRNNDGPIDSTKDDRVFILFGLRRGGSSYYAFDVTNRNAPKLMWRFTLPDGAQSWSNPSVSDFTRINIASANWKTFGGFDNSEARNRFVAVIGGGFDPTNDIMGYAPDIKGNKIYMLDVASGDVLWSAGPAPAPNSGDRVPDLELSKMTHSIVGDVRVIDLSGDRFADRMYAADLGGQVWRFDINNGAVAADLVDGGVMASVGVAGGATEDRRFYYAPDVAEVRCNGRVFYNVAIGSGDRENPVYDQSVDNTFYSFRDYLTRTPVKTADYLDSCSAVTTRPCFQTVYDNGASLVDATSLPNAVVGPTSAGWRLDLVAATGEKALAESRTFDNNTYFTTYAPESVKSLTCGTQVGVNRLYTVTACDATPVFNNDGNINAVTVNDRSQVLAQGSIAPEVVFVFPTPPPGCNDRSCIPPPQCLVGLMSCGKGAPNDPVRVFWRESGAE